MLRDGNDNDDELITLLKTEVIPTLKKMKRLLENLETQGNRPPPRQLGGHIGF